MDAKKEYQIWLEKSDEVTRKELSLMDEKQILENAYQEYMDLKKANLWGTKKYF